VFIGLAMTIIGILWQWPPRTPPSFVQPSPPPAVVSLPPKILEPLPAAEIEKRVRVLDSAYEILRTDFEDAINFGTRIANNTWPDDLQTGGPQKLRVSLKEFLTRYSDSAVKLGAIQKQYVYYDDIQSLINQSYQKELQEGITAARHAAEALPDPLAGNYKFLFQPYADKLNAGISVYAKWTNDTKEKIIAARNEYLKRMPK
jgi:hypothetical protein